MRRIPGLLPVLRQEPCSYCKGTGTAEVLEVWSHSACMWLRARKLQPEALDAFCAANQTRWVDANCPRCEGAGSYAVEFVKCKIF